MTRPFNAQFHCPNCKTWQTQETAFGRWIRNNKELDSKSGYSVTDQDYVIHKFKTHGNREFQCVMIVEIKTMGAEPSDAQSDTLYMLDQLTRNRVSTPTATNRAQAGRGVVNAWSVMRKRYVTLKAFGTHLLTFSGLGPDDSDVIEWDRAPISIDTLTSILKFDLDPDTLKPLDLRRHHMTHENQVLPLFVDM